MSQRIRPTARPHSKGADAKKPNKTAYHTLFIGVTVLLVVGVFLVLLNTPTKSLTISQTQSTRHTETIAEHTVEHTIRSNDYSNDDTGGDNSLTLKDLHLETPEKLSTQSQSETKSTQLTQKETQPWETFTIKKGDSLSKIFKRANVDRKKAILIANDPQGDVFSTIQPGQSISVQKTKNGDLLQLRYQLTPLKTLTVLSNEQDDSYHFGYTLKEPQIRINHGKGVISHSLLAAARKSRIDLNTIYDFMSLFGWQVDFAKNIHKGDKFAVIYEEKHIDGQKISNGNIIAAELVLSGEKYQAVRYQYEDGSIAYFSPDGQSVKGTFLRTPIPFASVTSGFSHRRFHPVKNVWRAHRGTDYGALTGTKILATGDGRVEFVGNKGDYGKTIILNHGVKYKTLYAHMSKYVKGMKKGAKVKQGDVIGYVGSTGLATGPHLHYEFRVNGVHKNPVTVDLPKASPIEEQHKAQFLLSTDLWQKELAHINNRQIAKNDATTD